VAWMFVSCDCCVLSGKGLCDELITRPDKSYRLWCVVVCDLENSWRRRLYPALSRSAKKKKLFQYKLLYKCRRQCQYTDRWAYLVVRLRNGRWMRLLIRACWSVKPPEFIYLSI
jgi:hypothetical protein